MKKQILEQSLMFCPALIVRPHVVNHSSEYENTFPMNSLVSGDITYMDAVKSVKRFLMEHRPNGIVNFADSITLNKRVSDLNRKLGTGCVKFQTTIFDKKKIIKQKIIKAVNRAVKFKSSGKLLCA